MVHNKSHLTNVLQPGTKEVPLKIINNSVLNFLNKISYKEQCYHCPVSAHSTLMPRGEATYRKGTALLICLHCILLFHNQGSISRPQSVLPLKEKIDTNYSTSTVVPRCEVKKEVEQDNVERSHNARTGKEIRETIQMSYIQLSAAGGKAHVLKTVLQSHKSKKQSYRQGLELSSLRDLQFNKIRDLVLKKATACIRKEKKN